MKKSKKSTRDYHKVQKLADGGAVEDQASLATKLWDGFKAGAQDKLEDVRKMARGDLSGTTFDNRKKLWGK